MESDFKREERPIAAPGTPASKDVADRILSSRSSLEGERKQVTVLFADVAGFTSISAQLDPEEVRDLIGPALDIMASEVHAYEGTVAQFTGDGLMALFGAPMAHEDAPHRAIYAALAMQARLAEYGERLKPKGIELQMRIGVNTGLVIVGSVGDELNIEYTALGDTVNLASRMESSAEPGTVQVTESTYQLTRGYFDFSDLGEIEVKGKEEPVHAWRVLGALPARSRISATLSWGLSPFVGREKELDQLTDRYAQAKAGQGQVVGMVGEPGVGKSRLLLQFRELLPEGEYTYLEGGCIHYGEAIAYLPILGILRSYFDIQEGENEEESKRKMDQRLASLNGQLTHILPSLQELLSLEVDDQTYLSSEPAQRRERIFEAIRYLLIAESQQQPLILAIEDLHWIDKTTEEFLSSFIEGLPAASVLLLLLCRPEYKADWTNRTFYSQVRVDHLPEEPSTELLKSILSEGEVASEISDLIVEKTAGNPLFIEELTRGLLESGSIIKDNGHYVLSTTPSAIQVPDTIQGIIASRLDRLGEELKETMQVSSVIGREFSLHLLEEVTGISKHLKSCLLQLQSLEFIYEKSIFPEPEYIFKHTLTQEVAYESLLLKRRREIHGRVGQAIEQLHSNTLEDFYETLAYHYSRSEDTSKAIQYLELSADKSARNYSNREAVCFYQETIRMLDSQPETEEGKKKKLKICRLILDPLHELAFPEGSLEILQEAEKLSEELGDNESLAAVYSKESMYYSYEGDVPLSVEYSEKCFDTMGGTGDVDSIATVALNICFPTFITGHFVETGAIARKAIELLEEHHKEKDLFVGGRNVFANQCGWSGACLGVLGEFEEARAVFEKGLRCALEVDDAFGVGFVESLHSFICYFQGDAYGIIDHARKAIQSFEEIGVEIILGWAWYLMGTGYFFFGDYEEARTLAQKGLKLQRESGLILMVAFGYSLLALIRLAVGDLDGAKNDATEGLRESQETGASALEALALQALGRASGEADPAQVGVAERYIRQGISTLEERMAKPGSAQGYLFLGEVFELAGRREEAVENLSKAERMWRELGVAPGSYWLIRTQEALARLEPLS